MVILLLHARVRHTPLQYIETRLLLTSSQHVKVQNSPDLTNSQKCFGKPHLQAHVRVISHMQAI